jgi:voltage-gated potassium channel
MGFTIRFLILFPGTLIIVSPILLFLSGVVLYAALHVKRLENWTTFDTIYFAFVTATTVGYGDYRPKSKRARIYAITIALTGLVSTGIMVSAAMNAVGKALQFTHDHKPFIEVWHFIMSAAN